MYRSPVRGQIAGQARNDGHPLGAVFVPAGLGVPHFLVLALAV